jgi:hypothetical protein
MRIGVFYFPTDYGVDIRELTRDDQSASLGSLN